MGYVVYCIEANSISNLKSCFICIQKYFPSAFFCFCFVFEVSYNQDNCYQLKVSRDWDKGC